MTMITNQFQNNVLRTRVSRPNPRLRALIRTTIDRHFARTGHGIYYEELTITLGAPLYNVTYELDFIGDEDIQNGEPPSDAIVVQKVNGIPTVEHFDHKMQNYARTETWPEYYIRTINQLAIKHGVTLDPGWLRRVNKALR